jgi:hypothetical protein
MIPQSTPLYLVTAYNVDGEPHVTNEMVVGWEYDSPVYLPVTVRLDRVLLDNTATIGLNGADWQETVPKDVGFGSQRYSTKPLTLDDLDKISEES